MGQMTGDGLTDDVRPVMSALDYLPRIRRYAFLMTGSKRLGDQLVELALVRWAQIGTAPANDGATVAPPGAFGGVVRHFEAVAADKRRPTVFEPVADEPLESARLRQAMLRVDWGTRRVALLRFLEGLETRAVAAVLDMPETDVEEELGRLRASPDIGGPVGLAGPSESHGARDDGDGIRHG